MAQDCSFLAVDNEYAMLLTADNQNVAFKWPLSIRFGCDNMRYAILQ
jgi:hypothetical protein